MKNKIFILFFAFCPLLTSAQNPDAAPKDIHRFGVIGSFDLAYNFQDKVLGPGLGRKWAIGLSYSNKKQQFIGFVGGGVKGFKINMLSPAFRDSFISDVQKNYVPVNGASEDSLVGAKMNGNPAGSLNNSYSQYLWAGIILTNKWRPTLSFYMGHEEFLLYGGFAQYEDPQNHDIDYVGMKTTFYEFNIGCTVPSKKLSQFPLSATINIGYKWVDYGSMSFNSTPLSAYTTGALAEKYRNQGKFIVSLSFYGWSNWGWD